MNAINLNKQPLNLDYIFNCGQAFRWQRSSDGIWYGVVQDKLVELKHEDNILYWETHPIADEGLVRHYLRLDDDIKQIYEYLSEKDNHLASLINKYRGLRVLRQEPTETLFSFMCSAATSIPRISASISELSNRYGEIVCYKNTVYYKSFPTIKTLADANVDDLRAIKTLAFRGRNIHLAANQILEKGDNWLPSLKEISFDDARNELISIRGIGEKMADCICLFSLDKDEAVPIDTHIRQVAMKIIPDIKCKTITNSVYKCIRNAFFNRYGEYAGWAQQFLFLDDL